MRAQAGYKAATLALRGYNHTRDRQLFDRVFLVS
jgi:hypothetical protein